MFDVFVRCCASRQKTHSIEQTGVERIKKNKQRATTTAMGNAFFSFDDNNNIKHCRAANDKRRDDDGANRPYRIHKRNPIHVSLLVTTNIEEIIRSFTQTRCRRCDCVANTENSSRFFCVCLFCVSVATQHFFDCEKLLLDLVSCNYFHVFFSLSLARFVINTSIFVAALWADTESMIRTFFFFRIYLSRRIINNNKLYIVLLLFAFNLLLGFAKCDEKFTFWHFHAAIFSDDLWLHETDLLSIFVFFLFGFDFLVTRFTHVFIFLLWSTQNGCEISFSNQKNEFCTRTATFVLVYFAAVNFCRSMCSA